MKDGDGDYFLFKNQSQLAVIQGEKHKIKSSSWCGPISIYFLHIISRDRQRKVGARGGGAAMF